MRGSGVVIALQLIATAVSAQTTPSPSPTPPALASSAEPSPASEYRVGPGDVLEVVVFDNNDLSRTANVQTNGTIHLPILGEVPVVGLTVPEIQRKLVTLLARDYLVRPPKVEVKITVYQSQFVTLLGEVNRPGRVTLRGRTRLIDALVEAGGFTPKASGEVQILRKEGTFDGGDAKLTMRFGGSLNRMLELNLEVPLRNGDVITASAKSYVTVEGEVNRPDRYAIEEDFTVSRAILAAGGLTRFGSSKIKVFRINPKTGKADVELKVNLKAIRTGKQPDLGLLPNDRILVSRRLF